MQDRCLSILYSYFSTEKLFSAQKT